MLGSASYDGGHGTAIGLVGFFFLKIKHKLQEHTEERMSWRTPLTHIYLGLLGDGHIVGPWGIGTEKRNNKK